MVYEQEKTKINFDQSAVDREFNEGYLVMFCNKRSENPSNHKSFQIIWLGPYQTTATTSKKSIILKSMEGDEFPLLVNKRNIKPYIPPLLD